jgi:hypothetical protein
MSLKDLFASAIFFALVALIALLWVFNDIYQWLWSGI